MAEGAVSFSRKPSGVTGELPGRTPSGVPPEVWWVFSICLFARAFLPLSVSEVLIVPETLRLTPWGRPFESAGNAGESPEMGFRAHSLWAQGSYSKMGFQTGPPHELFPEGCRTFHFVYEKGVVPPTFHFVCEKGVVPPTDRQPCLTFGDTVKSKWDQELGRRFQTTGNANVKCHYFHFCKMGISTVYLNLN